VYPVPDSSGSFGSTDAALFLAGDTVIAYGFWPLGHPIIGWSGFISRTTDNGNTWQVASNAKSNATGPIQSISRPIMGLLMAGEVRASILWSSDMGQSWMSDTILCSTRTPLELSSFCGWSNGRYLAIDNAQSSFASRIYEGVIPSKLRVELRDFEITRLKVYPNPASQLLHIEGPAGAAVLIVDALGRVVRAVSLPSIGTVTLSMSEVPSGLYQVVEVGRLFGKRTTGLAVVH
jgi:hypothetical protein